MKKLMRVLGIETSCDETGIAIYDTKLGLLAHTLYSQVKLHAEYGGVVPELASRDHVHKIIPLVEECLSKAQMTKEQLDGVAYTQGPGLIGALLVGACFGRSLAFALNIPAIGVHHMEGHLLAPMLEEDTPPFPFLALLVSGGHTMLVAVKKIGDYEILGESLDDAAGEAFDKTAKLMGLDYPGGPLLAKLARMGGASDYKFPRPMTDRPGLDFSFSGLKTYAANAIAKASKSDLPNIAFAFEDAIIDTLLIKIKRALIHTNYKNIVIAGGVSANTELRKRLTDMCLNKYNIFFPRAEFCTDNGAMIAYAGAKRLSAGLGQMDDLKIAGKPRWSITELNPLTD